MAQIAVPSSEPLRSNPGFDFDAQLERLPKDATCKGFFFRCVLSQVPRNQDPAALLAKAGVDAQKFMPLTNYPVAGFYRFSAAVAQVMFPQHPTGEGMRRLGWTFYKTLSESVPGRIVFGVLGRDAGRIFSTGHFGWRMSTNFGRVDTEIVGKQHVRYHFTDYAFVDTMQAGVIEGALKFCGVTGSVQASMRDIGTGVLDVRWS